MIEEWRKVVRNDAYEVSSLGNVRRVENKRPLKPNPHTWGTYFIVRLYGRETVYEDRLIHRLVLESFIGPGIGLEGNHKNLNRQDNRLENLEWVTRSQNMLHAHAMKGPSVQGSKVGTSKVTENEVRSIRKAYSDGETQVSIARRYGMTQAGVSMIVLRKNWKHVL